MELDRWAVDLKPEGAWAYVPQRDALKFGAGAALGLGLGYRYGFGSRFLEIESTQQPVSKAEKEVLEEQKTILQSRLAENQ
jgi:hypothetical protein